MVAVAILGEYFSITKVSVSLSILSQHWLGTGDQDQTIAHCRVTMSTILDDIV